MTGMFESNASFPIGPEFEAYGLQCRALPLGEAPVGCMICEVAPGQASRIHNHFESEVFLFLSGKGAVLVEGIETEVVPGATVEIKPFSNHVIRNDSCTAPMQFMSVYWVDPKADKTPQRTAGETLIFSTPPTPNGDLHLGHLSGPYLAADIYRRGLKQNGIDAIHVTGRDDHQTYVTRKARSIRTSASSVADSYAAQIRRTLTASNIPLDFFIEPNAHGSYAHFVSSIFKRLYEQGLIYEKEAPALFDAQCGHYLHEAFVTGQCPHCGEPSDGNACEQCGRPNQCVDLRDPESLFSTERPLIRPCRRLFFKLDNLAQELATYVNATPMSAHARAMSNLMVKDGLPEICVSHPTDLGIPIPIKGYEDQKIYVWFEMAAGYLWASANTFDGANPGSSLQDAASAYGGRQRSVVHFYGFDNTYYHTLLFPAVYFALGLKPPSAHVLNELLDLDHKKFSTSRGHLIWAHDLLSRVPTDYVRWALSAMRPEGVRSNFSIKAFCNEINDHFYGTMRVWTRGLMDIISREFEGKVPEPGAWTSEHQLFHEQIQAFAIAGERFLEIKSFSPRSLAASLKALAEVSSSFLASQSAFVQSANSRDFLRTSVALSALALRTYATYSWPIIPDFAHAMLIALGLGETVQERKVQFLTSTTLTAPEHLPTWPSVAPETLNGLMPAAAARYQDAL